MRSKLMIRLKPAKLLTVLYFLVLFFGITPKSENAVDGFLYFVSVIYVLFLALFSITSRTFFIHRANSFHSIIVIMFFLAWIYGIIIGVINQNTKEFIIRNNAGMIIYLLFFVLPNAGFEEESLGKMLLLWSRLSIVFTIVSWLIFNYASSDILNLYKSIPGAGAFRTGWQNGFINVLHTSRYLIMIAYARGIYIVLKSGKVFRRELLDIIFSLVAIYLMKSSGFNLALLAISLIILVALMNRTMNYKTFFLLVMILISFAVYQIISNGLMIKNIFGRSASGNIMRYSQLDYVFDNFSFLGKGFGAEYTEIGRSYGIEISYLDLIYKLGVFSLPLFFIYSYSIIRSITFIRERETWISIIPIACLGFLFVAFGNPVLFSFSAVVLHLIALYYIEGSFEVRKND